VNRVLAMTAKGFDGRVPEPGPRDERDEALLATVDATLIEAAEAIEHVELRRGLRAALTGAQEVNAYLNATEPWRTAKVDRERTATTLWTAIQAIAGLAVAFAPYVPFSSGTILGWLGLGEDPAAIGWRRPEVPAGTALGAAVPLFPRIETVEPGEAS
jgi:methionyl-tRNA synthetase